MGGEQVWAASGFPGALLKIGLRSLIWGWFKGLRSGIQERDNRGCKEPKAEISCGWCFPPKPETLGCVSVVAGEESVGLGGTC